MMMNPEIENATSRYEFTVIVPIFNEEEGMLCLEQRLADYLPIAALKTCVLLVNDGSTDRSLSLIREICCRHKDFYYISLVRNTGLSGALKAGIDVVGSPWLGYIDADLQTLPEDFNLLLSDCRDYEMVMGIRAHRKDTAFKKLQSRIANSFRRMMTHDDAVDTNCPLKVLRTDCARRIPFFKGMHRFLPALVQLQEGRVKQIPVRHFPRVAGESKYHLRNRLVGPLVDCFAYRWMRSRYIRYRVAEDNLNETAGE